MVGSLPLACGAPTEVTNLLSVAVVRAQVSFRSEHSPCSLTMVTAFTSGILGIGPFFRRGTDSCEEPRRSWSGLATCWERKKPSPSCMTKGSWRATPIRQAVMPTSGWLTGTAPWIAHSGRRRRERARVATTVTIAPYPIALATLRSGPRPPWRERGSMYLSSGRCREGRWCNHCAATPHGSSGRERSTRPPGLESCKLLRTAFSTFKYGGPRRNSQKP